MRCNAEPSTSDPKRSRTPDGSSTSISPGMARDAATGGDNGADTVSWTGPGKAAGTSGLISTAAKPAIAARSICLRNV